MRAHRKPKELALPDIHVGLAGHLKAELIEADGSVSQTIEQSNMILDSGLDYYALYGYQTIATYAAVGTGSTAPATTQTALAAEVARTAATGGISTARTRISPGVVDYQLTREFTETQAVGNLTEWGFSPVSSGSLFSREQFRDGSNNPIVVTKTNAQKLRLTYTIRLTILPIVLTTGTFTMTNLGVLTGKYMFSDYAGNTMDLSCFEMLARGTWGAGSQYQRQNFMMLMNGAGPRTGTYAGGPGAYTALGTVGPSSVPAYTPGSFQRGGSLVTFGTAQANGLVQAIGLVQNDDYSNERAAWWFALDPASEFTKTNLDQVNIRGPGVSWGRG